MAAVSAVPPARGVGAVVDPPMAAFLAAHPASLDYLALTPETLWADQGPGAAPRYVDLPAARAMVDALAEQYPVACHAAGPPIAGARPLDEQHLAQVARTAAHYHASRCAEQLDLRRAGDGALERLVPQVRRAADILGLPLLLEACGAASGGARDQADTAALLSRLAGATGCGVLLNLYALHATQGHDGRGADAYLDRLDLGLVREIHVAGDTTCPPSMLALLQRVVPACPHLEGITFEAGPAACRDAPALQRMLDQLAQAWSLRP